jgi:hypothetical protein
MDSRKRGCLWAGIGIGVVVIMVGVALAAGTAWLIYQNTAIEHAPSTGEQAKARFDETRQRFDGQAPLVLIGDNGEARVVPRTAAGGTPVTPESFHVMVWKPSDGELTHVRLPFWLVRIGGAKGKLRVNGTDTLEDLAHVSIDDIERAGAGLVLDHRDRGGSQVLIWTE